MPPIETAVATISAQPISATEVDRQLGATEADRSWDSAWRLVQQRLYRGPRESPFPNELETRLMIDFVRHLERLPRSIFADADLSKKTAPPSPLPEQRQVSHLPLPDLAHTSMRLPTHDLPMQETNS